MGLLKTIAGHLKPDGEWEPQRVEEMEPHEEEMVLAQWAIGESEKLIPIPPTTEQELAWLIENGADFVKQKRAEHKALFDPWEANHNKLKEIHAQKCEEYCKIQEAKENAIKKG